MSRSAGGGGTRTASRAGTRSGSQTAPSTDAADPAAESRVAELQALAPQMMPLYEGAKGGSTAKVRRR